MKKIIKFIKAPNSKYLLLLLVFSLFSCEEVVHVDLEKGEPRLVIDAEILWRKGTDGSTQTIRISRMTDYYNPNPPKVSGAQVHVENSTGVVFTFTESDQPGAYVCTDFIPVLNETYTLHVNADGEMYTASETLMPVSKIERVEQRMVDDFGTEAIEVSFYFNDPANEANFYLTDFVTDILNHPDYELSDDDFNNGNEIRADFSDEKLKSGHTVNMTLRGISQRFYNYMNLILSATDNSPFSTPPGNIRGNIVNQANAKNYALGYFRLCESDYVSYVVQ